MSRCHLAKQSDGYGWMLLRLVAIGQAAAHVVACNLPEEVARQRLADLRAAEPGERS